VRWRILLRPRWLAWHAFAVLASAGMLLLGDWQLHRALSGNELSWAYTFEWPLFTIFGIYFWAKTLRDEMRSVPRDKTDQQTGNGADSIPELVTADAYVARLKAEVQSHGKWHGWR
jgi:DNA-binding transcriptional regulator of glucitol operon